MKFNKRELDRLIAEKVMASGVFSISGGDTEIGLQENCGSYTRTLAKYSTDIMAAFEILKKFPGEVRMERFEEGGKWEVNLGCTYFSAHSVSLCEAICIAALQRVGVKV